MNIIFNSYKEISNNEFVNNVSSGKTEFLYRFKEGKIQAAEVNWITLLFAQIVWSIFGKGEEFKMGTIRENVIQNASEIKKDKIIKIVSSHKRLKRLSFKDRKFIKSIASELGYHEIRCTDKQILIVSNSLLEKNVSKHIHTDHIGTVTHHFREVFKQHSSKTVILVLDKFMGKGLPKNQKDLLPLFNILNEMNNSSSGIPIEWVEPHFEEVESELEKNRHLLQPTPKKKTGSQKVEKTNNHHRPNVLPNDVIRHSF